MESEYRVVRCEKGFAANSEDLQAVMESEGYSVFHWSDDVGAIYPVHMHGDNQSHWIISGRLELTVEGYGIVVLKPGDRDFMPAGTSHSAQVLGDEPVAYLIGAKK